MVERKDLHGRLSHKPHKAGPVPTYRHVDWGDSGLKLPPGTILDMGRWTDDGRYDALSWFVAGSTTEEPHKVSTPPEIEQ